MNLQQPLGRVDSSEVVFWITKDDADFFVDEDEFGWHAWIGCDAGIALGPASAWGAWGGAATEPFTPPKTDLSVDVAPLAAER